MLVQRQPMAHTCERLSRNHQPQISITPRLIPSARIPSWTKARIGEQKSSKRCPGNDDARKCRRSPTRAACAADETRGCVFTGHQQSRWQSPGLKLTKKHHDPEGRRKGQNPTASPPMTNMVIGRDYFVALGFLRSG